MLFTVLQALSFWEGEYPFPHERLLPFSTSILQYIVKLKDLRRYSLSPSRLVDHSRGSAYVEVAHRLAILFTIEARLFSTLRVASVRRTDA